MDSRSDSVSVAIAWSVSLAKASFCSRMLSLVGDGVCGPVGDFVNQEAMAELTSHLFVGGRR